MTSFDYWCGVVSGLLRMGTVSRGGKAMSFAGLTAGAWFGEGTVLKSEPRRYDMVALRDSRLALMDRATFFWLYENSVAFNRFLVAQLNERLGQFIGLVEYGRTLDATGRLARSIASLFNPLLYPDPNASPGDHPGGNRSVVRHLPAERQPVPEAVGEGRSARSLNMAGSPSSTSIGFAAMANSQKLRVRGEPAQAAYRSLNCDTVPY